MKSKSHWPNLHRVKWTPNWVFRKHSSAKGREFVASTGVPARPDTMGEAYSIGLEKFNEWLGDTLPSGRTIIIRDIGRALKASKKQRKWNTQRAFNNQIDNHIIPHFGHLKPDQVTSLRWESYDAEERARVYTSPTGRKYKRTKLFKTRAALKEILSHALEAGLIRKIPKLKNLDDKAAPPRTISEDTFEEIRDTVEGQIGLLVTIMYYQGARPSEVLQYRWDMITWKPVPTISIPGSITKTGRSRTIPLNSKVARTLRELKKSAASPWVFPSRSKEDAPMSSYNTVWDRTMERLGLDYTIYNFRDTFITNRLKAGLSSVFIGKYCDTSSLMIDKRYAVAEEAILRKVAK